MESLKIATAQFESRSGDKNYNFEVIKKLSKKAADEGAKVVAFHECDNGIYVVFSNTIDMDADQLKNGCSMILDPFGDVIAECRNLDDEVVTALCTPAKIEQAGGMRYKKARRPDLYKNIIGKMHTPEQKVAWLDIDRDAR